MDIFVRKHIFVNIQLLVHWRKKKNSMVTIFLLHFLSISPAVIYSLCLLQLMSLVLTAQLLHQMLWNWFCLMTAVLRRAFSITFFPHCAYKMFLYYQNFHFHVVPFLILSPTFALPLNYQYQNLIWLITLIVADNLKIYFPFFALFHPLQIVLSFR